MIKIDKPNLISQGEIIDKLTSNMREDERKHRILCSKQYILSQSDLYDKKAQEGKLSDFTKEEILKGGATKKDMKELYERKFVTNGQPGRNLYEEILAKAPNRKCPYCGYRIVTTLDHYLPKSNYPVFAVTPENLIPSCRDCNSMKLDTIFKSRNEETIHPYYDDFTQDIWIKAKMHWVGDWIFTFFAEGSQDWTEVNKQRVVKHFSDFDLDKGLYRALAIDRFPYYKSKIYRSYKTGGKSEAVKELKEDILDLQTIRMNGWEQAMVQAIIDCDEFWHSIKN